MFFKLSTVHCNFVTSHLAAAEKGSIFDQSSHPRSKSDPASLTPEQQEQAMVWPSLLVNKSTRSGCSQVRYIRPMYVIAFCVVFISTCSAIPALASGSIHSITVCHSLLDSFGPSYLDFSGVVWRLAYNRLLFRPRPLSPQQDWMNKFILCLICVMFNQLASNWSRFSTASVFGQLFLALEDACMCPVPINLKRLCRAF